MVKRPKLGARASVAAVSRPRSPGDRLFADKGSISQRPRSGDRGYKAQSEYRGYRAALLKTLRVLAIPGRARGLLIVGPFRIRCALGPAGVVHIKREGDGGTPAGRFPLLWGYYRPDRPRPPAGGVRLIAMRGDTGWCENPASANYNRLVRAPSRDATDRMWRADALYDLTFILDQNYSQRAKGRGSAVFFHIARPDLTPTAGCVAIPKAAMRRIAPRLARGATIIIP